MPMLLKLKGINLFVDINILITLINLKHLINYGCSKRI
jgi:hypothetical protein